jgi:hypothetical protein
MINATVQVNLPRLARLNQDLLRLMAFLGRENGVSLRGRDTERAENSSEFLLIDEGLAGVS